MSVSLHTSIRIAVLLLCGLGPTCRAADFVSDIRPILQKHCISCHGPQKQEGGLRLDQRAAAMRGGENYNPAIVPKSSDTSPLFQFVSRDDADLKMPPKGDRLSAAEIQALKEWIDAGADWPDAVADLGVRSTHWAFQPLTRPAVPGESVSHPIDAFVRVKLAEHQLTPSPEADRRTLIRRLSFDLLGLPPTPEEVAAFVADSDPLAYEKLVDRYLASPQFGERAARFWLDAVRFAESDGFETNQPRPNAWRYRDYVIDAFNRDLPYDQFIRQQLAGDQLGAGVATGFIVGGAWDRVKSPDPVLTAQQRADELHDMVSTTGSVFLGLTVGCARCHSHKFDPIPQTDYYAMKAVFEGVIHGEREIASPVTPESQKRVDDLTREIAQFDAQLREFEPLATLRATSFIRPTDTLKTQAVQALPTPAIAKGEQRGASLDPGQGSLWPNLSSGYLYWKVGPGTDVFLWKPQLKGKYRFWTSWGCGHKSHTTDARYLLDRDGNPETKDDQQEFLRANHQRFADESDLIPEQPLWSGLKDGGVLDLTPESAILLRQGDQDSYVTTDAAVFQSASEEVEDRPALRIPVTRDLNVERFRPTTAKHVRFTINMTSDVEPCIDELEVFGRVSSPVTLNPGGSQKDSPRRHGGTEEKRDGNELSLDVRELWNLSLRSALEFTGSVTAPNSQLMPVMASGCMTRIASFATAFTCWLAPCLRASVVNLESAGSSELVNVALASRGTKATASGTYPNSDIHKLEHINDGLYGNSKSWISNEPRKGWVQFEFSQPCEISEIRWSRDRGTPPQYGDRVATNYVIETSLDGEKWTSVASSRDRLPFGMNVPGGRLIRAEGTDARQRFEQLQHRRVQLAKELAPLVEKPKAYAGMFVQPPATHRLNRGDVTQPREVVAPASLSELGTPVHLKEDAPDAERRLALADWMVSRDNPLTARVIVNRLWLQHFGEGIVDTPSDFGANGGKPTHPELLDWLAAELVEGGETRDERRKPEASAPQPSTLNPQRSPWSLKHIHRLICLSSTYRQSSSPRDDGLAADAASRLLWRYPPRRLEAESIRDAILAVSGQLDLRAGGPGFDLFEPNTNYVKVYNSKRDFTRDDFRRMIYQNKPRMQLEDTFGTFDCPDAGQVTPKRTSSTTALQALSLLNSPFLLQQSQAFADRVGPSGTSRETQVTRAFEIAYQRAPTPEELQAATQFVEQHGLAMLCRAIYNTHEFVTVR